MKTVEIPRKTFDKEARGDEARLLRLVDILQHPSETIQEFLDYALKQAIELTESRIGYIYHYNEERCEFVLNTWSEEVMEACHVEKRETTYQLDKTGIWGEAVRQRRPIVINDFQKENPLKKGCPKGHVPMTNFLTIPIFKHQKIVGVVGLANKETDFDENDLLNVTLLMEAVWTVTESKKAEQALAESEERFRALHNASFGGIAIHDGGVILECNQGLAEMFQYTREELIGMDGLLLIAPEYRELVGNNIATGYEKSYEAFGRRKNGEIFPMRLEGRNIPYKGKIVRVVEFRDITKEKETYAKTIEINRRLQDEIIERKYIEEALRASEEKFKAIIETSPDGIAISTLDGIVEFATEKSYSMWGFASDEECIGRNIIEFIHESHQQKAIHYVTEMLNGNLTGAAEYLMVKKDGSQFYCEVNANILRDKNNNPTGVLYIERDVTERKHLEEELKVLAIKDQLTGLYNRRKIDEVLINEKAEADSNDRNLSVIMVDIDLFKLVNDQYGHLVGDQVLTEVTEILAKGTRSMDVLGRWGGEEFIIICTDTDLDGATVLAEKLREMIAAHEFKLVGKKTCSFGVSQLHSHETIDALLIRSDQALYRAKDQGRNRVVTEF
ncbi:MAG: diguanylate cyclase [Acetobacterium sp.]|uniref:sensor domain-containing diguanylate cyclase n=1 Tax=Acetobacterium sp. TaxID=1872094 RepID=UPI003242BE92